MDNPIHHKNNQFDLSLYSEGETPIVFVNNREK